ncbi:MAG: MerR family transcriptional regulator [Candidatus Muiribacteriota bacterium]
MDREILYTIGDLSKLLGINASKIRFWMKQFPEILTCKKTSGGQRRFTYDDYLKIKKVKYLIAEEKLTLEGVKKFFIQQKSRDCNIKYITKSIFKKLKEGKLEETYVENLVRTYL